MNYPLLKAFMAGVKGENSDNFYDIANAMRRYGLLDKGNASKTVTLGTLALILMACGDAQDKAIEEYINN